MSYILEAIKKSDQERKQGEIPDIHTLHVPLVSEPSTSAMKTWLIILLVLINVVFLAWILLDDRKAMLSPVTTNQEANNQLLANPVIDKGDVSEATQTVGAVTPTTQQGLVNRQRDLQRNLEVASDDSSLPSLPSAATATEPMRAIDETDATDFNDLSAVDTGTDFDSEFDSELKSAPDSELDSGPDTELDTESRAISAEERLAEQTLWQTLPQLGELPAYLQQQVPALSFSSHMYSSIPSSRNVILNGRYLKENQPYNQSLLLELITEEGVVFQVDGEQFRVAVIQQWNSE